MNTICFDFKEQSHPISVLELEENGNTYYEVDFVKGIEDIKEIISFSAPLRFDEKGYGPKAKSMEGVNLLISMWKSIDRHFKSSELLVDVKAQVN